MIKIRNSIAVRVLSRLSNMLNHGAYIPTEYYVFDDNKVIYIPIPKVACTSIKLSMLRGISEIETKNSSYMNIHNEMAKHSRYSLSSNQLNYFKFAFVRDPFERLVSCYKDKVKKTVQHNDRYHFDTLYNNLIVKVLFGKNISSDMSFYEFAELVSRIPDFLSDGHFKSQYSFIYNRHRHKIDYIGKFEQLDNDWNDLADKYGYKPLPHSNPSNKIDLSYYYDSHKILDLVAKRYRKDIIKFNYGWQYEKLNNYINN